MPVTPDRVHRMRWGHHPRAEGGGLAVRRLDTVTAQQPRGDPIDEDVDQVVRPHARAGLEAARFVEQVRRVDTVAFVYNPCDHTELPKVSLANTNRDPRRVRALVGAGPAQYRLMLDVHRDRDASGPADRIAPAPLNFLRRTVSVEETIVETSKVVTPPPSERFIVKPYPKNNEPRTFGVCQSWPDALAKHLSTEGLGRDDHIFTTKVATPISRNSFRTHVWLPAVAASGVDFAVRVHDLRHAHASWLLCRRLGSGASWTGHAQIQTTQKYLHAFRMRIRRTSTHSNASRAARRHMSQRRPRSRPRASGRHRTESPEWLNA